MGVQIISLIILGLLAPNFNPNIYRFIIFILYIIIFVSTGFFILKLQDSSPKMLLSTSLMSMNPFLITLFNVPLPGDSFTFLFFDLARPPITLSDIFLPVDVTTHVTTRHWLELVSMPLPVLSMWIGWQLKMRKPLLKMKKAGNFIGRRLGVIFGLFISLIILIYKTKRKSLKS